MKSETAKSTTPHTASVDALQLFNLIADLETIQKMVGSCDISEEQHKEIWRMCDRHIQPMTESLDKANREFYR
jgi:hypothetical protein